MSQLFSPITIRNITFKNRIVVSPMCEYSSEDGFATDWHLVHLGSRAVGGAALVIQEATAVSPEGRITYGDLGIWKDEHIEKLQQIVSFIHAHGAVAGIQLAHAGRKASHELPWKGGKLIPQGTENSWQTVSSSAIAFSEGDELPLALDNAGIDKVINDFVEAAKRTFKVGYKVIEIHAAHGYLISQFLSPLTNKRTDEYGGSFENRIRLLLQVVEAIRKIWPQDYPLFVRISAIDWAEGGWDIESSVKLAAILKTKGVDLIDTSSGGVVKHQKITVEPGYQVGFAEQVKKEAGILTGAVGLITNAQQAEDIVTSGKADMILLARQFLRDPYFPLHAAHELKADIAWPIQYERAK
ncbi:NADPH dehydrogenase NamA [Ferruginibacter albus]|uniref:NADPH dehydrogenase NamA n=1 Tax=Ferruginibacter albus TaxID=2875540 RepID=UPI001CC52ECE|nr:NADPH dehydrogenase NamA [Ferruginibacter albus]UAY52975.1 NADPH dehydrogenase NamA [Ferruginibacter albus]